MAKWIENQKEIEDILNRALVGRLGVIYETRPYLVPVHFVYHDKRIAFHSGLSGQKLEALEQNPQVCFEVDELVAVVPNEMACFFTSHYRSVIASGTARLVQDQAEKTRWLKLLIDKYAGAAKLQPLPEQAGNIVNVVEIEIEKLTAKAKLPP